MWSHRIKPQSTSVAGQSCCFQYQKSFELCTFLVSVQVQRRKMFSYVCQWEGAVLRPQRLGRGEVVTQRRLPLAYAGPLVPFHPQPPPAACSHDVPPKAAVQGAHWP